MPLSWNGTRERAIAFTREWKDEDREHAEAKSFWDAFFNVFGMSRKRLASSGVPVKIRDQKDWRRDIGPVSHRYAFPSWLRLFSSHLYFARA